MDPSRLIASWAVAVSLVGIGCDEGSTEDSGPRCVPADVAGVWDIRWVDDGIGQISCGDVSHVWTISQSGCDVTIGSESWDPANGATGSAGDGELRVEWTWYVGCHGVRETVYAAIDGDTLSGTYYRAVWQQIYPADCSGGGLCSATFNGTRRRPGSTSSRYVVRPFRQRGSSR